MEKTKQQLVEFGEYEESKKELERKFEEFVDIGKKIDPEDWLICYYYVEGIEGYTPKDVGAAIAAESSIGTWTHVTTETKRAWKFAGRVIDVKGNYVLVAFPIELFEPGNIPQLLSVVAGNLFGLKAIKNCRLLDIRLPKKYIRIFRGPRFGIKGIRKIVGTLKEGRPHVGTIIKPKVGLTPKDTAKVGYEVAMGGIDHIKDDETLADQRKICPIEKRLTYMMEALDRAKSETGKTVLYTVNVTHETTKMIERAEKLIEMGANAVMMDVITCGFAALKELRREIKVPIHVHRCMHASFTRNPFHGISMNVVAKLVRLAGGDQFHIGTVVGKMHGELAEVRASKSVCEKEKTNGIKEKIPSIEGPPTEEQRIFEQNWYNIKPMLAISSGGLHPGLVPEVIKYLGFDIGIQFGGGIHGHPLGSRAGTIAARQAVEACMKNISLEEYAKTHEELKIALDHWGYFKPKA
ncbi:MAG: ribulose-bisphosphate carboxylase large subunit [Candidatus Pacearchaeota archaeon]|nr:ribulose-bisphosphate carboxylase large subunit [Candidatus Pacearchaeota archaeon]